MRTITITFLIVCSSLLAYSQSSISGFFHAHNKGKETTSFFIPGWLFKAGFNLAAGEEEEMQQEMAAYQPLFKGLHGLHFLAVEESRDLPEGTVTRFVQKLRKKDYVPLLKMRSKGTSVNILMKTVERKDQTIVKKLLVVIQEENDLILCAISGKWKTEDLERLMKEEDVLELFADVKP